MLKEVKTFVPNYQVSKRWNLDSNQGSKNFKGS